MKDEQRLSILRRHIQRVMRKRKWDQKTFAKAAGLSETDVSRILRGSNPQWIKGSKVMDVKVRPE